MSTFPYYHNAVLMYILQSELKETLEPFGSFSVSIPTIVVHLFLSSDKLKNGKSINKGMRWSKPWNYVFQFIAFHWKFLSLEWQEKHFSCWIRSQREFTPQTATKSFVWLDRLSIFGTFFRKQPKYASYLNLGRSWGKKNLLKQDSLAVLYNFFPLTRQGSTIHS